MAPLVKKLVIASVVIALLTGEPGAVAANPIGDFFKKVGRTLTQWRKNPTPAPRHPHKSAEANDDAAAKTPTPPPVTNVAPTPTPVPIEIRPAALAPHSRQPRDVPYAVAVPNKPGFVRSPYAPDQGLVDVRGFPSSTEVMDPFTGKIFLTP